MRGKKNLKSFASALCAGVALLSMQSCDNDDNVINEEFEITTPGNTSGKPVVEEVTSPTAILGNMGGADSDLKRCFTNIVAPEDAKVIIVESGAMQEYEEVLSAAYNKGVLIAVFNPESSVVEDWSERNDIFYAGPEKNEKCSIYGFNNRGTYYSLHADDSIDEEDIPLFHFCNWINDISGNHLRGVDLRSKEIKKRFLPQKVTHTFKIALDREKISEGHWGSPEQLTLSTTANVTYDIYPIHVFDGNATGDYYAVEAEMVLHNAPLDNGLWTRRRGDELAQICGFYLNRCDLNAGLLRKVDGSYVEATSSSFAEGAAPRPLSAADAALYNPGFEWGLDATVSGGVPDDKGNDKLTMFNQWMWKNTSESSLANVEIKNEADNANVSYSLLVNGLPGVTDYLTVTPVPDLSTGDLVFKSSWIWRVADMDESSKDCVYMQVSVDPLYQAYQWVTAGKMTIGEFGNSIPESRSSFWIPLTPPNRVATCSTILRNSSEESYYIDGIKLWRNKTTDKEPDIIVPQTICTPNAHGGSGVSATMLMLPAGDYLVRGVRYSVENDERVNEVVIGNTQPITLTVAGNATIDFGSDIFTVM